MGLILFAKRFIEYVYSGCSGINFSECELERQGLGEQKDQIIEVVYNLYKQGLTKEEALVRLEI